MGKTPTKNIKAIAKIIFNIFVLRTAGRIGIYPMVGLKINQITEPANMKSYPN
jgi:hypothetical protein